MAALPAGSLARLGRLRPLDMTAFSFRLRGRSAPFRRIVKETMGCPAGSPLGPQTCPTLSSPQGGEQRTVQLSGVLAPNGRLYVEAVGGSRDFAIDQGLQDRPDRPGVI